MQWATSVFLAVSGKKKVPLVLDFFQGTHLCLDTELKPMGVEKTTGQVGEALNIEQSVIKRM